MSDILIYSSNVKIITDENFESDVLGASVPVFVFFMRHGVRTANILQLLSNVLLMKNTVQTAKMLAR